MRDVPASPAITEWLDQVERWPIHSARRSFQNFRNHVVAQQAVYPDLTMRFPDLMFHAEHTRVEPKVFFHYGAPDREALAKGLAAHWGELETRLRAHGVTLVEVWAGSAEDAALLDPLGFQRGDEMAWYRFDAPRAGEPDSRIRDFDEARDFERLMEIHRATSPEVWWLSHDAYLAWVRTVHTRVLEVEGALAAYTHLRRIGRQGLFDGLAVHPDFQRRGLASALVRDALGWCAQGGATSVDLFVLTSNEPGIALYERLDFTRMGTQIQMKRPV